MNIYQKIVVTTICLAMLILFIMLGIPIYRACQNGPCILTIPHREAERGLIYSDGFIRGTGNIMYSFCYPGIYERSGKECLARVNVTKGEYERIMYKGIK